MDIPSLFFVEATILLLFGVIMLVDSLGHRSQARSHWFAASNFCGAFGLLLRPVFPHGSPIVILLGPNLLLFLELTLLSKAIADFVGHGRRIWLGFLALSVAMTATSAYGVYWHPSTVLVANSISVVAILSTAFSAYLLFRYASPRVKTSTYSMAFFFSLYALHNLLRLASDWVDPRQRFYHILFDRTILAGLSVSYLLMSEARLRHLLQDLADRDPLTGLLNRRAFEGEAQRRVDDSYSHGRSVSALMIDIDHFKSVNDRYGHHAGDQALQVLADALRRTMRDTDLIVRLGGDEFVVMLPGSTEPQAAEAAERLRRHLANLHVSTDKGEFHIQVSIGIISLNGQHLSLDDLMKLGDRNLYLVKSGRAEAPLADE